jgi:dissimilatory sulfite reductase (desulfoviridin) alpha/beta subunit
MQLWVKYEDDTVRGAFVTQILNYPQMKILLVLLLGGNDFIEWRDEVDEVLFKFGKEHSCKFVEFFGRKGWGNYLKDINYKEQVRMFSKEIV